MKVLVTGANGFIGANLVHELIKDGTDVRVTTRKGSDTRNLDNLDVEKVYCDIRDKESVKAALKGCDTLYHTAAYFAHWSPNTHLFYDINVEGTRILFEEALAQGLQKVVYTSTSNSIGSHGVGNYVNETAEFNGWESGDHYAISKYLAEIEAQKICKKGLPLVIVNPTLVIGVRDRKPTPSGALIVDIANRNMPGYIEGAINVIDVEDVARGQIQAAKKGKIGERYLFGNENLFVGEFFQLIADIAGVKPPKLKIPYRVALLLGHLFQVGSRISKKPPVVSVSQVKLGKMGEHFDCSKAVSELGLKQTPIKTTIEKAIKWYRENGYIK
ncbi:ADP-L-glycero-D-manno-heptose-6-epimerase [Candidatus Lokiarchaeum ossiferum]|uniref:ADP-L-glycero-D-manno-heptose-6-epimerase n=1 Tax=Candidatus Lokiarchaeum ossiferum TaxID=2951803 RepID=A0ABY6HUH8_9ARCH|nr:ADP-L-glycero-D-manno-heptose-6-epimerase [Candidatus Lokiarchaeum sp. B-35]